MLYKNVKVIDEDWINERIKSNDAFILKNTFQHSQYKIYENSTLKLIKQNLLDATPILEDVFDAGVKYATDKVLSEYVKGYEIENLNMKEFLNTEVETLK